MWYTSILVRHIKSQWSSMQENKRLMITWSVLRVINARDPTYFYSFGWWRFEPQEINEYSFIFLIHHIQGITTHISTPHGAPQIVVSRVCVWGGGGDLMEMFGNTSLHRPSLCQRKPTGAPKWTRWVVPEKMYPHGTLRCMSFSWLSGQ